MTNQEETKLTQALADFQPTPSNRFHQRMDAAPWMAREDTSLTFIERLRALFWRPVLSTAVALMLLVGVVALTPPLRAFAQDLLGLITQEPTDVLMIGDRELTEDDLSFSELVFVDPYEAVLAETEKALGFNVWVPEFLLPGYQFDMGAYDPGSQTVFLTYINHSDTYQEHSFQLMQRPANADPMSSWVNSVGASAEIDVVQINDTQGEYVEGTWSGSLEASSPFKWESNTAVRRLIWQQGGFVFTISASGDPTDRASMDKQEMIGTARNLTPEYVPLWERNQ